MSECENHILPQQRDYAGLQLSTFTSRAAANSRPPEDSTNLCRGSGNPFGEYRKTLFLQLATLPPFYIQMFHLLISLHRWQMSVAVCVKDPIKTPKAAMELLKWTMLAHPSLFITAFPLMAFLSVRLCKWGDKRRQLPLEEHASLRPPTGLAPLLLHYVAAVTMQDSSGAKSTCRI